MEELEKKEPKKEERNVASIVWEYMMFVWFVALSLLEMNLYLNLTQIEQRLNVLERQKEIPTESQNIIHLQDTGSMINGYPKVSCGKYSFTSYVNSKEARENSVFLESIYSQVYFEFSCESENNEPYSQVNLILPNGEKFEISVEDGKAQVIIPLFEPGIYVVETLLESQEVPLYIAFQWRAKAKTEIIMLKGNPHVVLTWGFLFKNYFEILSKSFQSNIASCFSPIDLSKQYPSNTTFFLHKIQSLSQFYY